MTTYSFAAESFVVEGDPEAVRGSARQYARFAQVAGEASNDIRSLESGSWVGSEGDTFRAKVAELPPPLDVAHTAFGEVSRALEAFAAELESAQRRMRGVRADAEAAHSRLQSAADAQSSLKEPTDDAKKADPQAQSRYDTAKADAASRVSGAQGAYQDQLRIAQGIRDQVKQEAARQAAVVRAAGRRSPTANQNWFSDHLEKAGRWVDEHLSGLRHWIGEHAGVLRVVATAMRWVGGALMAVAAVVAAISAVAGFFSFGIGWLGEVPAGLLFTIGGALYGGGEALDTAVDWGEGKIDGQGLIVNGLIDLGTLGLAAVGGPLLGKAIKAGLEHLPESVKKKAIDWVESVVRRIRGDKTPTPIGKDNLPGVNSPLKGGTKEHPRVYAYRNDAVELSNTPRPTARQLAGVGRSSQYTPGTPQHMLARYNEYLIRKAREGQPAQEWAKWRDTYIRNAGHAARGTAFERAFYGDQGFSKADGWTLGDEGRGGVTTSSGAVRHLDVVNVDRHLAYELKSGNSLDPAQLAKDVELQRDGWQITYIFGGEPTAATLSRLDASGIRYQVWHAVAHVTK